MDIKAEIASLEKRLNRSKRATNDEEIRNEAIAIKNKDDSLLMQIASLEKQIEASECDEMEGKDKKADQNDKAEHNWNWESGFANDGFDPNKVAADENVKDDEVIKPEEDKVEADLDLDKQIEAFEKDEVKADDEEEFEEELESDEGSEDISDEIKDVHDQVLEVVKNPQDALKQATKRLDRLANYLEKNGNKKLAYRLDCISDSIESRIK